MSFIYPRTVTITRPTPDTGIGVRPFSAEQANQETLILANVAASIQYDSTTRKLTAGLPADIYTGSRWMMFICAPLGTMQDNDIITDDLGIRYQVHASYWDSFGYNAKCEKLQN